MTKFEQVMQQLQDSVDTARTIEGVEWCQVKKAELEALIGCAKGLNNYCTVYNLRSWRIQDLEACADE